MFATPIERKRERKERRSVQLISFSLFLSMSDADVMKLGRNGKISCTEILEVSCACTVVFALWRIVANNRSIGSRIRRMALWSVVNDASISRTRRVFRLGSSILIDVSCCANAFIAFGVGIHIRDGI